MRKLCCSMCNLSSKSLYPQNHHFELSRIVCSKILNVLNQWIFLFLPLQILSLIGRPSDLWTTAFAHSNLDMVHLSKNKEKGFNIHESTNTFARVWWILTHSCIQQPNSAWFDNRSGPLEEARYTKTSTNAKARHTTQTFRSLLPSNHPCLTLLDPPTKSSVSVVKSNTAPTWCRLGGKK